MSVVATVTDNFLKSHQNKNQKSKFELLFFIEAQLFRVAIFNKLVLKFCGNTCIYN